MFDWGYFNKEIEWVIEIPSGRTIKELGVLQDIEVNEEEKRVYVTMKHHRMEQYFEERVRDIIRNMGYDPEIEFV